MALFRGRALSVLLNAAAAVGRQIREDGRAIAAPLRSYTGGGGHPGVFAPAHKLAFLGASTLQCFYALSPDLPCRRLSPTGFIADQVLNCFGTASQVGAG